jgi:FKBP-type peptidyl-prolyl cis-trans isomerase FkpA
MASSKKPPSNRPTPAKPAGTSPKPASAAPKTTGTAPKAAGTPPKTASPVTRRQQRKAEQERIRRRQQVLTGSIIAAIVIVALIIIIPLLHGGSGSPGDVHATQTAVACSANKTGTYGLLSNFSLGPNCSIGSYPIVTLPDGVQYADITIGSGQVAQSTDTVTADYEGWLTNGTEFDSSSKHGGPQQFSLGSVIPGWTEAIPGMQIGGERRLLIPGPEAYGANPPSGSGIPANATLIFDVTLVSIP